VINFPLAFDQHPEAWKSMPHPKGLEVNLPGSWQVESVMEFVRHVKRVTDQQPLYTPPANRSRRT
jgi:hypothetical protein